MPPTAPQTSQSALRDIGPKGAEDGGPGVRGEAVGDEAKSVEEKGERDAVVEEEGDEGVYLGGEDGGAEEAGEEDDE